MSFKNRKRDDHGHVIGNDEVDGQECQHVEGGKKGFEADAERDHEQLVHDNFDDDYEEEFAAYDETDDARPNHTKLNDMNLSDSEVWNMAYKYIGNDELEKLAESLDLDSPQDLTTTEMLKYMSDDDIGDMMRVNGLDDDDDLEDEYAEGPVNRDGKKAGSLREPETKLATFMNPDVSESDFKNRLTTVSKRLGQGKAQDKNREYRKIQSLFDEVEDSFDADIKYYQDKGLDTNEVKDYYIKNFMRHIRPIVDGNVDRESKNILEKNIAALEKKIGKYGK